MEWYSLQVCSTTRYTCHQAVFLSSRAAFEPTSKLPKEIRNCKYSGSSQRISLLWISSFAPWRTRCNHRAPHDITSSPKGLPGLHETIPGELQGRELTQQHEVRMRPHLKALKQCSRAVGRHEEFLHRRGDFIEAAVKKGVEAEVKLGQLVKVKPQPNKICQCP